MIKHPTQAGRMKCAAEVPLTASHPPLNPPYILASQLWAGLHCVNHFGHRSSSAPKSRTDRLHEQNAGPGSRSCSIHTPAPVGTLSDAASSPTQSQHSLHPGKESTSGPHPRARNAGFTDFHGKKRTCHVVKQNAISPLAMLIFFLDFRPNYLSLSLSLSLSLPTEP